MEKRILILDDDINIALDLQKILDADGYHTTVFHDMDVAVNALPLFNPQLAICDINLGRGATSFDFAFEAKRILSKLEVIYVTTYKNNEVVGVADLKCPFSYIIKPWNKEQINTSVNGKFQYLSDQIKHDETIECLSPAESNILELIANEKKSKEIAEILFISEKTVRNHRYNIMKKLKLPNENNSLLKWAIKHFNK